MRIRAGLALGTLVLIGTLTACGGGGDANDGIASANSGKPSATASNSGGAGETKDGTAFAKCMRDNGVPEFPDPETNGSMILPEGADTSKLDSAQKLCQDKLPGGGEPRKLSAEDQEKQRKFAQCMRDNGLTEFPDPEPGATGSVLSQESNLNPEDPKFKEADQKCEQYHPSGLGAPGGKVGGGMK
ncbi:hypothetical protein [Amycolatopsis taiwanensis]|uniref:Secreted protein n=1 Tax=Amycolatopsis taiwanensis TaxID=342230 RepID=A0A9W6VER6_9PSEU|nr:hypothetical protein [Amycolatopsis taiwanensis]GLY66050.1 hypothetical protein Atai01_26690 [Amycolatopsis taiwanensis]